MILRGDICVREKAELFGYLWYSLPEFIINAR